MKIKKLDIKILYAYIMVVLIMLSSEAIYEHVYPWWGNTLKLLVVGFALPSFLMIKRKRLVNLVAGSMMLLVVLLIWTVGGSSIPMVLRILLKLIPVLLFVGAMEEQNIDLLKIVYNALFFLICISLIFFVLFDLGIAGVEPSRYIWELNNGYQYIYTDYLGIYYRWHRTRSVLGFDMISANGLWHEPGAYQIYANLGLFMSLFMYDKKIKIRPIIFILAVISSTSTMGLLIMVLLIVLKTLRKINPIKLALIEVAGIVGGLFIVNLLGEKMTTSNWFSRTSNLLDGLFYFLKSPVFGYDVGSTPLYSGLLAYLTIFGSLGLLPLYVLVKGVIKKHSFGFDTVAKMAFLVWYVLSMLDENYAFYNLMFLIYGICIYYKKNE